MLNRKMGFQMVAGLFLTVLALSACGSRGKITRPEGKQVVNVGYGQNEIPSVEDNLETTAEARPERSDEILRRSEKRQDDYFELPPE